MNTHFGENAQVAESTTGSNSDSPIANAYSIIHFYILFDPAYLGAATPNPCDALGHGEVQKAMFHSPQQLVMANRFPTGMPPQGLAGQYILPMSGCINPSMNNFLIVRSDFKYDSCVLYHSLQILV
jgi:hypothetical protein